MRIKFFYSALALLLLLSCVFLTSCKDEKDPENTDTGSEEETVTPPLEYADGDDLIFQLMPDGKSISVAALNAPQGARNIEIPEKYEGLTVTAIGADAFSSNIHLESIFLPETITHIGDHAFDGCVKLTSINIPKSIEFLGDGVFDGCTAIKLTEYEGAMYFGSEDAPYTILAFVADHTIKGDVIIHDDTRIIYELAFAECVDIDNITIPSGIRHIGKGAFENCYSLTDESKKYNSAYYLGNEENPYLVLLEAYAKSSSESYTVHEDTQLIAPEAFKDCSALLSVTFHKNIRYIGADAFEGCEKLSSLDFDRITTWTKSNGENITEASSIENSDQNAFLSGIMKSGSSSVWTAQ